MKKQKHSRSEDDIEDKKPVTEPDAETLKKDDDPEEDIQSQKLSEIESTEVASTDSQDESIDPDKLVTIIPKATPQSRLVWWKQRKYQILLGVVFVLIVLLAIPPTRFLMLGWIWRENVTVTILDTSNNTPVSDAVVTVGDRHAMTDSYGKVTLTAVPLGAYTLHIEKPNYKNVDTPITVDVFSSTQNRQQSFTATGRPQTFRVVDRLTSKPIAEATVTDAKGVTLARTNGDGRATVVIPVNAKELNLSVAAGRYRVLATKLSSETKTLQLVPDGVLYFLSKASGKIDVVKSNLDGSDRKVIVAGTGNETDATTTLLASRDWKYLALKSKRTTNKPESLFLIDTSNDSMKLLDEGKVTFDSIGWSGHHFIYNVTKQEGQHWAAKQVAIKSYNAEKSSYTVLDENASDPASNDQASLYERLGLAYILDDRLVYTKSWSGAVSGPLSIEGKQVVIVSVRPDGSDKKTVKSFAASAVGWIDSKLYLPQEVTFRISDRSFSDKYTYGELEDGVYKTIAQADLDKTYPTYLMSPSGNSSFWYEERDGKNALFIGDKNASDKQELVAKSEFKPYGWLTDDYLLLQKGNSELYITTKAQLQVGGELLKVGDYHKARTELVGYGYGYGGQ